MGEAKRRAVAQQTQALPAMAVDTPGGRIHVQWDHQASATGNAQLAFLADLLQATGLYQDWVQRCPLSYTGPNSPSQARRTGHLDAGHPARTAALRARHQPARRWRQPTLSSAAKRAGFAER
jgi:hypothetical protein